MSLFVVCAATSVLAQSEADWMNEGVRLFKGGQYGDAVQAFRRAVELNPSGVNGHQYLGTALLSQWIPGGESAGNRDLVREAQSEFETVVRLDPRNLVALQSLASVAYNLAGSTKNLSEKSRMFDQAVDWNQKSIQADPQAKEAYYSLGVIAWSRFYPEHAKARALLGMRPETPGPIRDASVRQQLTAQFGAIVQDGIANLEKALEIDPSYDDAMAYLNLLIRERADLRDTPEQYAQDVRTADEWVGKALAAKKAKAGSGSPWLRAAAPPPPPPPPAPPPSGSARSARIRVAENVQEANLITRVEPVYPPLAQQARIQGAVRFSVIVGKDGHVQNAQLISGHPLLVPPAMDAVRQWVYRPTLLNGEPVDVVTVVELNFTLNLNQ